MIMCKWLHHNFTVLIEREECIFTESYDVWDDIAVNLGINVPPADEISQTNYLELRGSFTAARNSWADLAATFGLDVTVNVPTQAPGLLFLSLWYLTFRYIACLNCA